MASFSRNSEAAPSSRERTRAMSSIDKLMVQGIRSFGATDSDKAVIQFGKPLTLITGQNGAGKTTVIECLRYATTGELPPNSKGGAFVHDPKLIGEREVKGVVKLKFHDIIGCAVVCSRMLQSTQKPKKLEQRTLDSSMEKISHTGQKIKITSRCGEIDREMISHLGVSKAILNHVIFCHQEESAWPLSEGKALKAKFDEIFASTRYTKALENIRSFQKEQVNECKVYNAELMHLSKQKAKVEELQGDLKETQRKVDASKAEITRIKNELTPMEERVQELDAKYNQVTTLERRIAELETSKKEKLRNQNELKSKIEHPFTGSMAELQQELDEHHSQLERNGRELKEVERKHGLLSREMEGVSSELTKCSREHERYKTEEKYHQQRVRLRDDKITTLASSLNLDGYDQGPFSTSVVKQFLTQVAQLRQELEEKVVREKQSMLEKERSLQEQVDELRTNLASLEQSRTIKEKTASDSRKKISEIGRELATIGSGGAALHSAEQELHSAERELSDYKSQVDIPSLEVSLRSLHGEKSKMDEKVFSLQGELGRIVQQSSARGALEAFRKQRRNKEEDYQNQMCGVEPDLLSVLGHMPGEEEDLEGNLTHFEREKNQILRKKEAELRKAESQLSQQRYQKEEKEKQLTRKKERMQELQAEVSDVCGDSVGSFEEIVEKVEQDIEETNENLSTIKGSQSFFRKSLEKVHASNKCPLCSRQFEDQSSLETTINSLTTRLNQSIPKMLPVMTEKLQSLQARQRRLQELKPKIDELSSLRSGTVPQLERELKEKVGIIKKAESEVHRVEGELNQLRSEMEQIRSLQPRVVKVSQLRKELKELDKKISSEESKLGGGDCGRSHHIVNHELQEAQRNVDELNRKMDHKRQEKADCQETLQQLNERVHSFREEKLRLQSQLQKREALVSKKGELTAQIESLDREIKTLINRIGPVKQKMLSVEQEKRQAVREREESETNSREEVDSLRTKEQAVKENNQAITRYINGGSDKALHECESRLNELQGLQTTKDTEKKGLESKIKLLQKQLANRQVHDYQLSYNLNMMRLGEEIGQNEREIKKLKDQLRSMGLDKYEEEYGRLQRQADHLRKEQARREGQKLGQEDQARHLQRELQSDLYSGTETKHKDMLAKLKTTDRANKDLEKYYKALDRAIMRYHNIKMEEINKIIKELWNKTYKGGDIDTIEIRSEGSKEDGGASLASRRTYNYRVVMLKGGTALDMRGRCSAGQKVLACIIIRLALAETFCLHSGLLALDEPTTNLDKDNVDGLAQALADIVGERSKNQKNFQLIVISHDWAFVDLISRSGYSDCYYRVSKNVGECSKIDRRRFAGD